MKYHNEFGHKFGFRIHLTVKIEVLLDPLEGTDWDDAACRSLRIVVV
jgi:hypothetical protein